MRQEQLGMRKIAVLHDYFDEIGGAEITLCYMARELNAVIFTTNIDRDAVSKLGFDDVKIMSIGKVPRIGHFKQLFAQLRFFFLKVKGFDLYILGGCCSVYGSKNHQPNIWYCFSPQRGLYDLRYFRKGLLYFIKQTIKEVQIYWDQKAVKRIENIIAPSHNIKKRILKYYKRSSVSVIHSPINTNEFKYLPPQDYWLSVQRIDPYKNIELQLEAFSHMKDEQLFVVGNASCEFKRYFRCLRAKAPTNVTFIGPIFDRMKLIDLYANCKGFITTSYNEDFGMAPIEAMASGKPVIAPSEGGYKESVVDGITGKLIDDIDSERLIQAVEEIGKNPEKYRDNCLNQAKRFDVEIFVGKIKQEINSKKQLMRSQ